MAKPTLKQKGLGKEAEQVSKHAPHRHLYFLLLATPITEVISPG